MKIRNLVAIAAIVGLSSVDVHAGNDARDLVRDAAIRNGVPVDLALRVAKVETGVRCNVVGSRGERGPLQILPATAREFGFRNIRSASCSRQTDAGMAHLAACYRGSGGNWRRAAACHNQGISVIHGRRISESARRYAQNVLN